MRQVKVSKTELLGILKKNREEHREIFLEAQDNYRKMFIAELDSLLEEAKSGKRIRRMIKLVEPMDQTKEYDRAIRMLEMSVDTTIELDEMQFRQLVMDDWTWKDQFLVANSSYSPKAMALMATTDADY